MYSIDIPISRVAQEIARRADDLAAKSRASAEDAVRYALACGAELIRLRAALPGTFSALLHHGSLVSFSARTAAKYIALAEAMLPAAERQKLEDHATALIPEDDPAAIPADVATMSVEAGKSLTQLYRDYGIIGRGKQGGRRAGAGRKPAAGHHESAADEYELIRVEAMQPISPLMEFVFGGPIDRLSDADLISLSERLSEILDGVRSRISERGL